MRTYPRNSPEAAARIVALVLIADGHVCRSELEALQQYHLERDLGLPAGGFSKVVHALCEDLLASSYGTGSAMCNVDEATLESLLTEVTDPALQRRVMHLAHAAAAADRHLTEAESFVTSAARRLWQVDEQDTLQAA